MFYYAGENFLNLACGLHIWVLEIAVVCVLVYVSVSVSASERINSQWRDMV